MRSKKKHFIPFFKNLCS